MVRIKDERNIEALRQLALLQDNENKKLIDKVTKLTIENARLRGLDDTRQLELEIRRELEKIREEILRVDEKKASTSPKPPKEKPKGHGPRSQPRLPVIDRFFELEESQRECAVCGGKLVEMNGQFEESEVVTVVKRSYVIECQRRQKYRCRCNQNVVTAPGPSKLQNGGRYSVEFAVEVAVSKYLDHLPLERQVRMMRREGLDIDSQTLWDQINALAVNSRAK